MNSFVKIRIGSFEIGKNLLILQHMENYGKTTHLFAIFIPFWPEEAGIVQPKQLERILIDGILQLLV